MSDRPLMPKATAVWLVDNTSLTFDQIAEFVGMHPLEVKGIADEDVAKGIKGIDPVSNGQLSREQIEEAEKNPEVHLQLAPSKYKLPQVKTKKTPRYTPVSKRQDKPDAIYWLIRNHPEMTDADVIKLIGTTKATISKIRERGHWNSQNIKAVDPVTLGLCSQIELDFVVNRAANRKPRQPRKKPETLKPIEDAASADSEPDTPSSAESNAPVNAEPDVAASAESNVPANAEPDAPLSAESNAPVIAEPDAAASAEINTPANAEPDAAASAEAEASTSSEPPEAATSEAPEAESSGGDQNQST